MKVAHSFSESRFCDYLLRQRTPAVGLGQVMREFSSQLKQRG